MLSAWNRIVLPGEYQDGPKQVENRLQSSDLGLRNEFSPDLLISFLELQWLAFDMSANVASLPLGGRGLKNIQQISDKKDHTWNEPGAGGGVEGGGVELGNLQSEAQI